MANYLYIQIGMSASKLFNVKVWHDIRTCCSVFLQPHQFYCCSEPTTKHLLHGDGPMAKAPKGIQVLLSPISVKSNLLVRNGCEAACAADAQPGPRALSGVVQLLQRTGLTTHATLAPATIGETAGSPLKSSRIASALR